MSPTLTVSSVESTQQIQTSTEVNLCSISVCFYKYGFWNTLFISVLPQKILKSVIQCLQTSTIVALCWAPFFTAWFRRVLVNLRSLCPCQQPKPFLIAAGSGSTQPLLSAHQGTTGATVPKDGLDLLRNREAPPGTAVNSPIPA